MPPRMRWTAYAGVSAALAGGVVLKAVAQRPNFYSAAVYLSQSSANLMILTNMMFVAACTVLLGLTKLLYGPLRPIETEQLYEKAWFAVTETCLAMTIFRGEIGAWFLIMFFSLLAAKVWGWIGQGRVEILEQQPPRNPRLFHTRLAASLALSIFFNMTMLEYIVGQVLRMPRPDMMVMFGFEFAVLSILSLSTAARYLVSLFEIAVVRKQKMKRMIEMRQEKLADAATILEQAQGEEQRVVELREMVARATRGEIRPEDIQIDLPSDLSPSVEELRQAIQSLQAPIDENEIDVEGWEGKGRWVFYLDLATDFFKLVVYLSFFVILLVFYGLPIHIMRDVFLTCRSFFKRISDFIKYRTATRDMNARYPDATAEEIAREDTCIICREEMRPYQPAAPAQPGQPAMTNPVAERMRPKKLPCGHILHFSCLRSWLERQQICPTCRSPVVPSAQAGNAVIPGQAGLARGGPAQHPPGARQAARVYQFGPLRIGVGAARGNNMFEDLQQQLQNDRPAAAPAAAPPAAAPVNANGPQQFGFGIRWDGVRRRAARRSPAGSIREQLDTVERQIQQELESIGQSTQELGALRNMQLELERVRSQRGQPTFNDTGGASVQTQSNLLPTPTLRVPAVGGAVHTLEPNVQAGLVHAGSENLPAGLTLPEGWSMMPLQRSAGAMAQPNIPGVAGMQIPHVHTHQHPQHPHVPGQQNIHVHPPNAQMIPQMGQGIMFGGPVPVPEHIRAMFSNMPGATVQHNGMPSQPPQATQMPTVNPISDQRQGAAPTGAPNQINSTAAREHERWLASLRNPLNSDQMSAPTSNGTNGDVSPRGTEAVSPSSHPLQLHQPTTSDAAVTSHNEARPNLPSWGSPAAEQKTEGNNNSQTNQTSTQQQPNGESSNNDNQSRKQPTVEDLVEGPD